MANYGGQGPPNWSSPQPHFNPQPLMNVNTYYGFNDRSSPKFQRGKRWSNSGRGNQRGKWFKKRGHPPNNHNYQEANRTTLKRDRAAMDDSEEQEELSPAEKMLKFHSKFHRVKKIARTAVRKHKKQAQDVKLPPGTVDQSLPTFEAQAVDLISKMELSSDQSRSVQQVLNDLKTILKTVVEDIEPVVYGSMCTGLALGTSDIDCYMESKVVPDGKERMSMLLENRKVLFKGHTFDNVIGIPKARVPILKATHVETGIEVDMNCTTTSGIYNSALINYLVHLDDRIRQLVLLIQTFYRSCKISGTNKVTSYAVTWLVLYYLQKLKQPFLPPLCKILYVGEGQTWPASFERSIEKHVDITQNKMTLTELYFGYFQFYSSFDFTKVISPYLGKELEPTLFTPDYSHFPEELTILKTFLQSNEAQETEHLDKRMSMLQGKGFLDKLMMLQDPIEHHLNTTWNIPLPCFELFTSLNQTYFELMSRKPETLWLVNMMPGIGVAEKKKLSVNIQKFPPVKFKVAYPLEGYDDAWPPHLIPDLTSVFNLLLLEPKVLGEESQNESTKTSTISFHLGTHYNVFKTRFKGLYLEVLSDPTKFESVKQEMIVIRDRMKMPESSFCAALLVDRVDTPNELGITIHDRNTNVQNVFTHVAQNLQVVLSKLLSAAVKLRSSNAS